MSKRHSFRRSPSSAVMVHALIQCAARRRYLAALLTASGVTDDPLTMPIPDVYLQDALHEIELLLQSQRTHK